MDIFLIKKELIEMNNKEIDTIENFVWKDRLPNINHEVGSRLFYREKELTKDKSKRITNISRVEKLEHYELDRGHLYCVLFDSRDTIHKSYLEILENEINQIIPKPYIELQESCKLQY